MKGWWEHLQDVKRALKYCHCVQEQSLSIYGEFEDVLRPSAVRDWTDSSVKKTRSFKNALYSEELSCRLLAISLLQIL